MKVKELRQKTNTELQQELLDARREQFNLRMQRATHQLSKPHLFQVVKRRIARIKTLLRERAMKPL